MKKYLNEIAYYNGVFKRYWDTYSFPLCVVVICIYIYTYKPTQITNVFPPVVVINPDGSSIRLLNDNSDEAYRNSAIYTANRVARIIFGYSDDGKYAANAAHVSKIIQPNSPASRLYREIVEKNLNNAKDKNETAIFTPNMDNLIASIDPRKKWIWIVILHGYKSTTTSSGTTTSEVTISFKMYLNDKRGEDGEIFKISDFTIGN